MKISFIAGEDTMANCIKIIKVFFKQIKRVGDRKAFIVLWYENNDE